MECILFRIDNAPLKRDVYHLSVARPNTMITK